MGEEATLYGRGGQGLLGLGVLSAIAAAVMLWRSPKNEGLCPRRLLLLLFLPKTKVISVGGPSDGSGGHFLIGEQAATQRGFDPRLVHSSSNGDDFLHAVTELGMPIFAEGIEGGFILGPLFLGVAAYQRRTGSTPTQIPAWE